MTAAVAVRSVWCVALSDCKWGISHSADGETKMLGYPEGPSCTLKTLSASGYPAKLLLAENPAVRELVLMSFLFIYRCPVNPGWRW